MLIKKTGNDKLDFAKRKGYEVSGHYFDGKDSFVLWKKNFGEIKQVMPSIKMY
jgi:hypothetical protein